jgi:uncharacterized protein (TIGR03437 family)
VITVFLTGQGAAQAALPITLTLGNRKTPLTFAGLSPDVAGLFQLNLMVPKIGTGSHPLVITVNGVTSNPRSVSVSESPGRK